MKIGFLAAMPQEATAYYRKAHEATKSVMHIKGTMVRVSGIGKVNAAMATLDLIKAGSQGIVTGKRA